MSPDFFILVVTQCLPRKHELMKNSPKWYHDCACDVVDADRCVFCRPATFPRRRKGLRTSKGLRPSLKCNRCLLSIMQSKIVMICKLMNSVCRLLLSKARPRIHRWHRLQKQVSSCRYFTALYTLAINSTTKLIARYFHLSVFVFCRVSIHLLYVFCRCTPSRSGGTVARQKW